MLKISFGTAHDGGSETVETTRERLQFDESLGAWRVRTDTRELVIPDEDVEEIVSDTGESLFGDPD